MKNALGVAVLLGGLLSLAGLGSASAGPSAKLVVHEWGTFTALQDETGDAIGGVNSQDEPLPYWTHDLARMLIIGNAVQGAPKCHPDVTLRLETPVVYFHRRDGGELPLVLDVRVRLRGGWLTQFYPDAQAEAPGLAANEPGLGRLTPGTVSELHWEGLAVGGSAVGPDTTDHVWLAPRNVKADSVATATGEAERFLFYRGVAHRDAPLRVARTSDGGGLLIRAAEAGVELAFPLWLVEVRENGTSAYRSLPWNGGEIQTDAVFAPHDFTAANMAGLRSAMHDELVAQGLFADEAAALLDTWELSYFKSPGLRLFFLVPRGWTDAVLPMELSVPAEVARVMVGRIEIVTPEQRELVRRLAALRDDAKGASAERERQALRVKLGRFADALILDAQGRR